MKHFIFLLIFLPGFLPVSGQWAKTTCPDELTITATATKGDTVFAATSEKYYVSLDQGDTWNWVLNGLPYLGECRSLLIDGSTLYFGSDAGVYVSYDNGQSFELKNTGYTGGTITSLVKHGSVILAGCSWNGFSSGVLFASDNQGQSWQCLSTTMNNTITSVNALTIRGSDIIAGTNLGVFMSTDAGAHWTEKNNGIGIRPAKALAINGNSMYCGTNDGIFVSEDEGENWTLCTNGLTGNEHVTSLKVINGHIFAGMHYGGGVRLLRSFETNWIDISAGLNSMQVMTLSANSVNVFAGTYAVPGFYPGGVYRQELSVLVGIDEQVNELTALRLFPDPLQKTLTIHRPADVKTGMLSLFNAAGQHIIQTNLLENTTQVDVSGLKRGIYFWQFFSGNSVVKGKIML